MEGAVTPVKTVGKQPKRQQKRTTKSKEGTEKGQLLQDARERLRIAKEEIQRMIRNGEDEALAAWRDERDIWEEKIERLEGRCGRDH